MIATLRIKLLKLAAVVTRNTWRARLRSVSETGPPCHRA